MPRTCETGKTHHTAGDVRGCPTCQHNGAAARIHAAMKDGDLVDPPAAPEPAAPIPQSFVPTKQGPRTHAEKPKAKRQAKPRVQAKPKAKAKKK